MKTTSSMLTSNRCKWREFLNFPKLIVLYCIVLVMTMNDGSGKNKVEAYGTKTVVVGLNAAFQKRFVLPPDTSLEPGSVHRAASLEEGIGGKGQDVAIALGCVSAATDDDNSNIGGVLLAQFLGMGGEGDQVLSMLSERGCSNDQLTVRTQAKLRTCTTIVASDVATELVEPSGTITSDEIQDLLSRISSVSKSEGLEIGGICIMGSMPPGCQDDMYASIHKSLFAANDNSKEQHQQQQPLVLVDSVVGLNPLLKQMSSYRTSSKNRGGMFKVNIAELCKLANVEKISGGEASCATKEEIISAVKGFLQIYDEASNALEYIAITDGKSPAHLVKVVDNDDNDDTSFQLWQLGIPNLSDYVSQKDKEASKKPLYPIGAGDTVAAGTLAAWQYMSLPEEHKNGFTLLNDSIKQKLNAWKDAKDFVKEQKDLAAATSFAFGLACGSASCLQQENSVLDVQDALSLFENMNSLKPIPLD